MVSKKTCIFIDGCFWHRCPKCYRKPKTNKKYWLPKLERNTQRDKDQNTYLQKEGWRVIRIWEHEIKENLDRAIENTIDKIETHQPDRKV